MKSVVIIGKGYSVLKSTKEFVDSFDDVAICNFPPMIGYEQYIGTRATYHFLNAHDPNPYDRDTINSLGLVAMYNTSWKATEGHPAIFPDHCVYYDSHYGERVLSTFKEEYGFHPSTGIFAFDFFVKNPEYDTIGLVGFDNFKVNEKAYYYSPQEVQPTLRYLYGDGDQVFTNDGYRRKTNEHDSNKSEEFVLTQSSKYDKKIRKL